MKTFVAVFTGSPDAMARFQSLPRAERQKRVTAQGVPDVRNEIGAYTVVRAETHDAAARMFEGHPHFTIFPGDGVDVMEQLPIPGV